jgi:hypothetical protein
MLSERMHLWRSSARTEEPVPAFLPFCQGNVGDWVPAIYQRAMELAVRDVKAQLWEKQMCPSAN